MGWDGANANAVLLLTMSSTACVDTPVGVRPEVRPKLVDLKLRDLKLGDLKSQTQCRFDPWCETLARALRLTIHYHESIRLTDLLDVCATFAH
jgi:hypothetical protein